MNLPSAVVAATDFSLHARRAARRAALLAKEHQLPLTLLHALDVDAVTRLTAWLKGKTDIQAALVEQARIHLDVTADEVSQQVGVPARTALRQGPLLAELTAAGAEAGLLVVGARGAHALRELTLGTTADRLLRKTRSPVLVVKSEPAGPYRRLLALVDFSPASEAALTVALALAPQAVLRLLHAFELPYESQLFRAGVPQEEIAPLRADERNRAHGELNAWLQRLAPQRERATVATAEGDVRQRAIREIPDYAPDLVVVGKQGRSALEDFFLGSVTRAMLSEMPCDVLVVPGAAA